METKNTTVKQTHKFTYQHPLRALFDTTCCPELEADLLPDFPMDPAVASPLSLSLEVSGNRRKEGKADGVLGI